MDGWMITYNIEKKTKGKDNFSTPIGGKWKRFIFKNNVKTTRIGRPQSTVVCVAEYNAKIQHAGKVDVQSPSAKRWSWRTRRVKRSKWLAISTEFIFFTVL